MLETLGQLPVQGEEKGEEKKEEEEEKGVQRD
jgi:hypothetical protein